MVNNNKTRIESLRQRVMNTAPAICHERAVLVTKTYQDWGWSLPPIRLRAKALASVLDEMSISIGKGELIVGNQASQDRALNCLPEEVIQAQQSLVFILTSMGCGTGHLAPDYSKVIRRGLQDIKREARERLENTDLSAPHTVHKADFYRAAIEVCEAVCRFADRYAKLAQELAASEKDPDRAAELNEIMKLRDRIGSKAFGGYPLFQNLIVGGVTPEGADATNPLSFLCLEVTKQLGLPQPSLSVRVHRNSPQDFLQAAGELAKKGFGMPTKLSKMLSFA
jgi:pyruvate-formate lyase